MKAKIRYTDTCYVVHQQWSKGGEPATFPLIQQYVQRRLLEEQQQQRQRSEPTADTDTAAAAALPCRCSKSESLLGERKTRRRRSRSLDRSLRRSADRQPVKSSASTCSSSTDDESPPAARKPPANGTVAVADVHHRIDSTVDTADASVDNVDGSRLDINHNRVSPANRAVESSVPVPIRRKQFFEPISDWSTSTSVDESSDGGGGGGDVESGREETAYETVEFRTEVRRE